MDLEENLISEKRRRIADQSGGKHQKWRAGEQGGRGYERRR